MHLFVLPEAERKPEEVKAASDKVEPLFAILDEHLADSRSLRDFGHGVQSIGRTVPHVDAGCLRRIANPDHCLLCYRPRDGRDGPFRPCCA